MLDKGKDIPRGGILRKFPSFRYSSIPIFRPVVLFFILCLWGAWAGTPGPALGDTGDGAIISPTLPAKARADLSPPDCVKCHRLESWVLATKGGKHNERLTCIDCHERHPPATWDVIPECGMCHIGEPHFTIQGCLTCHADPHAPLELVIDRHTTEPCVSCHATPGSQLREFKSFHSAIACTFCHYSHGFVPECTDCHKPHDKTATGESCALCHQAHMPLVVGYGEEEVVAAACGGCHSPVATLLEASGTRHADLACTFCHQGKHKTIPACGDCHDTPHPPAMMARFPECRQCHNIAHDLHL